MIKEIRGDLLNSTDKAILIPVNCIGVMGCGLALTCKNKYPQVYQLYRKACTDGKITVGGEPFWITIYNPKVAKKSQHLICFPTKNHFNDDSKLEWITESLHHLKKQIIAKDVFVVGIPALGAGRGKLPWDMVKEVIEQSLEHAFFDVHLYTPWGTRYQDSTKS